jgi:hypothetical protein
VDKHNPELLKLKATWYAKLKKKGFQDIEQDEERLNTWDSHYFHSNYDFTRFQAKEEYYRLAGQFLNCHKFKNAAEKKVWELHSSGKSIREIVTKMKSLGYKTYINKVHYAIKRLAKKMISGVANE